MSDDPKRDEASAYSIAKAQAVLIRAKYAKHPDDFKDRADASAKALLAAVEKAAKAAEYEVTRTEHGLSIALPATKDNVVLVRADPKDGLLFEYGTPAKIQATDIEYDPVRNRFVGTAGPAKGATSGPKKDDDASGHSLSDPNAKKRRNAVTVAAEALAGVLA